MTYRSSSVGSRVARAATWIVLAAFAALCIVPLLWLLMVPSKTNAEVVKLPPFAFGDFGGYARAWENLMTFQDGAIITWLGNSIWYTAAIVAISSVTALLAGYALALGAVPFRRALLMATLIAMIVPAVALVLPLFIEIVGLGIYNTPLAVILTSSFFPFGTFLAYIYFSSSIPTEIIEAARIDGCGEWAILLRVIAPLSKGLVGMLAFFSFTTAWSNYFLPFVMLGSTQNFTLPVGLGILFSSSPALNPSNGANVLSIGRPEIALAGLIVALPVLLVFLLSSRLLARGVFAGSVKS